MQFSFWYSFHSVWFPFHLERAFAWTQPNDMLLRSWVSHRYIPWNRKILSNSWRKVGITLVQWNWGNERTHKSSNVCVFDLPAKTYLESLEHDHQTRSLSYMWKFVLSGEEIVAAQKFARPGGVLPLVFCWYQTPSPFSKEAMSRIWTVSSDAWNIDDHSNFNDCIWTYHRVELIGNWVP